METTSLMYFNSIFTIFTFQTQKAYSNNYFCDLSWLLWLLCSCDVTKEIIKIFYEEANKAQLCKSVINNSRGGGREASIYTGNSKTYMKGQNCALNKQDFLSEVNTFRIIMVILLHSVGEYICIGCHLLIYIQKEQGRSSRCVKCDEQRKKITQTFPPRLMNKPNPSTYLPVYIQKLHPRTKKCDVLSHHSCYPQSSQVNSLRKGR